jgi:hypothetical protein
VLYGDGVWRVPSGGAGGLGFTPVDAAGDTMSGDLGLGSLVKITQPDEFAVKWQLKGVNAVVALNATGGTWDFNRAGDVTGFVFRNGSSAINAKLNDTGLQIGTDVLARAPAAGTLELVSLTHAVPHLTLYERDDLFNRTNYEAVDLYMDSTGAKLLTTQGGAGGSKPMFVGTSGTAFVALSTQNTARWIVDQNGHLQPWADNVYDLGASAKRLRTLYLTSLDVPTGAVALGSNLAGAATGMAFPTLNEIDLDIAGNVVTRFQATLVQLEPNVNLAFNNDGATVLTREASGVLALRTLGNHSLDHALRVYQNFASGTGYFMRAVFGFVGGALTVGMDYNQDINFLPPEMRVSGGPVTIYSNGQPTWGVLLPAAFTAPLTVGAWAPQVNDAFDIGTPSLQVRHAYLNDVDVRRGLMFGGQKTFGRGTHPDIGLVGLDNALRGRTRLYTDENFATGVNSVVSYNGTGTPTTPTVTRVNTLANVPNNTGFSLHFSHSALSTGFKQNIVHRANAVFVQQFTARLPVGLQFDLHPIDMGGTGGSLGTAYWVTDNIGTGKWETYTAVWIWANGGTPQDGGGIYVTGTATLPATWDMASATVFDLTDRSDYFLSSGGTLAGNVTLGGTTRRLKGDFSNATVNSRTMLQTATVNGLTAVGLIPDGTSQLTAFQLFSSSTNPDNSSYAEFSLSGASGRAYLNSSNTGSGTTLPLCFLINDTEYLRLNTAGLFGVGTAAPAARLDVRDTSSAEGIRVWAGAIATVGHGGGINFGANTGAADTTGGARIRSSNRNTVAESGGQTADLIFETNKRTGINTYSGLTAALKITAEGNVVQGNATSGLANAATDGFFYLQGMSGAPTGTPTPQSGRPALVADYTNNVLYMHNGSAWVAIGSGGGGGGTTSTSHSQVFTASGTFTVPANVTAIRVTGIGAGGGGSATISATLGGGGGGAGESCTDVPLNVTAGASITVTVGAKGTGAATGQATAQNGTDGGDSSFGSYLVLKGGKGANTGGASGAGGGPNGNGSRAAATPGGVGGMGTAESATHFGGSSGGGGGNTGTGAGGIGGPAPGRLGLAGGAAASSQAGGGSGASSVYGPGGAGGAGGAAGTSAASTSYGAGGGGAGGHATTTLAAGDGCAGYWLVEWVA